ncbi:MAG: HNH endonuclease [Candidatus Hydrogenedentes bacterium]|nr:HNH endonuclease [Candidatus Hydrogenedentota bacterium]
MNDLPQGGTLTQVLSADTALTNASTDIGFGVGERADYLFDDVRFFDPTATGEQSTIGRRYAYDARGRRVAETTFEDGVAETTYFVYDGHRVIEELDGDGNVTASYVYGQYIDEVLQMRRDTDPGAAGMEDHYYLHDDLFNVVGLTDASGALRERYEYADYGMPAVYDAANNPLAASAFQNAYLFNGRRFDAGTGLYYYRTRYMDPDLGRFISRDTIGLWGDANNLGNPYSYVGNNPWSRLDPFGEQEFHQSFGETARAVFGFFGDAHETAVAGPLREVHTSPGPIAAAFYNEILMVEPYGDLDLYTQGNNAAYAGTQIVLVVSPTKVFKVIKGTARAIAGATRGIRGTRTVVMMVDGADEAANLARQLAGSSDEIYVTLNNGNVIGDISRISKPKHAPVIDKWVKKGGKVRQHADGTVEYIDGYGNSVLYRNGYPDFKASGHVTEEVKITDMQGDYTTDFAKANAQSGKPLEPWETWHHHEDMTTMQRMSASVNARFTHSGGASKARIERINNALRDK